MLEKTSSSIYLQASYIIKTLKEKPPTEVFEDLEELKLLLSIDPKSNYNYVKYHGDDEILEISYPTISSRYLSTKYRSENYRFYKEKRNRRLKSAVKVAAISVVVAVPTLVTLLVSTARHRGIVYYSGPMAPEGQEAYGSDDWM